MEHKHTRVFPLRSSKVIDSNDINEAARLRVPGIAAIFQELAWEHAAELDYGYHNLREKNMHWVLSKMVFKVKRFPRWNEEIALRTWPSDVKKLFFIRDFEYRDTERHVCVAGSTSWLVVNGNGRPQIPSHVRDDIPLYTDEQCACLDTGFPEDADDYKVCFDKKVRQSDIDVHHHTNNVRYFEWAVDCLAENGVSETAIRKVEMNFLHECKLGDTLRVSYGMADGVHFVKGSGEKRDVFLVKIEVGEAI